MTRLSDIETYVRDKYPAFGPNKQQEIVRLLAEILRRDKRRGREILSSGDPASSRFPALKRRLVRLRFPGLDADERRQVRVLPKMMLDPAARVVLKKNFKVRPKDFFVEKAAARSPLVRRLRRKFPQARFQTITEYRDFVKDKNFTLSDYNRRAERFFVVRERYNLFFNCPCSGPSVSCGYQIMNLGRGCGYECVYCHLQAYVNAPGIVLPANIEDFLTACRTQGNAGRFGTGQLTDSLIWDGMTGYSRPLVEFFRKNKRVTFEFKTKSDNVGLLTSVPATANVVIGWSLNPSFIIRTSEHYTPGLERRLSAARHCAEAGYRIAFHFDPIILYPGWQKDYEGLVNRLFDRVGSANPAWISCGTLRMTPKLKTVVENRFPDHFILDEELVSGFDGKLRYPLRRRIDVYTKMVSWIRRRNRAVPVYLCMEEKEAARACGLKPFRWPTGSGTA